MKQLALVEVRKYRGCRYCHKAIPLDAPLHQKFCNDRCQWRAHRGSEVPKEAQCKICKKPFIKNKKSAVYCSKVCRSKNAWRVFGINKRYGVKLPQGFFEELLAMQKNRCALCGDRLEVGISLDHIVSLVAGGETKLSNLQLLCKPCNHGKYVFSVDEYIEHCRKVVEHHQINKTGTE